MPPGQMAPDDMLRPVLAEDRVRFQGEAIAIVVAQTRGQAVDATELVDVELDPLPVVIDPERALDDDATPLFDGRDGGNLAFEAPSRDTDVLGDADVVVRSRYVNQRLAAVPMEPGAAVAAPDAETGGVRIWAPNQGPHAMRDAVATAMKLEPEKVRITVPAVGGGFGARIAPYPEQVALAAAALRLGRPVRYVETPHGDDALDAARPRPGPGGRARRQARRDARRVSGCASSPTAAPTPATPW